jgi:hypothetical protein
MPVGAPYLTTANVLGKVHFTPHPPKSPKPSLTHTYEENWMQEKTQIVIPSPNIYIG